MKNSPWQPENKQARQSSSSVQIVQYSALAPENYDWIWPGWIARRKIHILSGPYEARNIAVAINIASILSNVNSRWPDKSKQSAGNVLIWSGGGDEIDMIVPLLKAAKCDMNHVHRLNFNNKYSRSVTSDINEDSLFFDQCIEEFGDIDLIIINPLINADASGSNKKLKALIIRLSEICSKHRCAILGIIPEKTSMHGKKAINRTPSYLANDPSIPMVMITAKVEVESETNNEQLNQYVLVRGKNLFSLDGGGLLYEIKPVEIENDNLNSRELINTWAVEWNEGMIDGNPDSILKNAENGQTFDLASKLNNAELFLRGVLSQGALFQSDIYNIAEQNEISTSSLRRASDNLAIIKQKQMGVQYGKWVWYLQGTPENEIFSHNKPSSQSLLPKKSFLNLNNLRTEKYVDAVARPEAKLLSTSVSNERAEALNQNKSPFPVSISNSIKDADLDDNKEKGKIAIVASKNASHPLSEVGGSGSSFENIDNIRSINFESLANKETQFNANQIDMTDEQMEIQQHNDDLDRAEAESKVDPVEVDKEEEQREIQEHNDDLARAEAESKIDQTDIDKEEEQKDIQQHYDDLDRAEAESKVDPVEVDKDDEQSEIQQHNDDLARAEAESKVDPVEVDKDDEQRDIQEHNEDLDRAEAESKVDQTEVEKEEEQREMQDHYDDLARAEADALSNTEDQLDLDHLAFLKNNVANITEHINEMTIAADYVKNDVDQFERYTSAIRDDSEIQNKNLANLHELLIKLNDIKVSATLQFEFSTRKINQLKYTAPVSDDDKKNAAECYKSDLDSYLKANHDYEIELDRLSEVEHLANEATNLFNQCEKELLNKIDAKSKALKDIESACTDRAEAIKELNSFLISNGLQAS